MTSGYSCGEAEIKRDEIERSKKEEEASTYKKIAPNYIYDHVCVCKIMCVYKHVCALEIRVVQKKQLGLYLLTIKEKKYENIGT